MFIRELGKKFNENDIGVSNEDCKEVGKNIQLRFIDSYRFMASSLDKLASNLDDDRCKHLREFYKEEEVFRLMRRKGVYPYEYMDGWEKFEETFENLKFTTEKCILQQG